MSGELEKAISNQETLEILEQALGSQNEASLIAQDFAAEITREESKIVLTAVFNEQDDSAYHLGFELDGSPPNSIEAEDIANPPHEGTIKQVELSALPKGLSNILKQLKTAELNEELDFSATKEFQELRMNYLATKEATAKSLTDFTISRKRSLEIAYSEYESSEEERAASLRDMEEYAEIFNSIATKQLLRSLEPDKKQLDEACSLNWEPACTAMGVEVQKFARDSMRAPSWRYLTEDLLNEMGEVEIQKHTCLQIHGEDFLVVGLLASPDKMPLYIGETLPSESISIIMLAKLSDIDLNS